MSIGANLRSWHSFIDAARRGIPTGLPFVVVPTIRLLSFYNLAVFDAARTNLHTLRHAAYKRSYRLKIRVPATTCNVVRVRDIVAELRAFAAKITYVCHNFTPELNLMSLRTPRSHLQARAKLRGVVGTSGFEPETSTVSR